MKCALVLAFALAAAPPAHAQLSGVTQDLSGIKAAIPPTCVTAPNPDTYTGSVGVAQPCVNPADASRATQVQSTTTVTASDGTFSGNWPTPFTSAPTGQYADIPYTAGMATPYKCAVTSTATGYSGKCWQLVSTTLPAVATSLLGLVVSPVANAGASLTVRVIGRQ